MPLPSTEPEHTVCICLVGGNDNASEAWQCIHGNCLKPSGSAATSPFDLSFHHDKNIAEIDATASSQAMLLIKLLLERSHSPDVAREKRDASSAEWGV